MRNYPIWLLTIDLHGRKWRFGSQTVSVEVDGAERLFIGTILSDLEVAVQEDFLSDAPQPPSVSVEVVWPENFVALWNSGIDLGAATAELVLWTPGTRYEDCALRVVGRVQDPERGNHREAVAFSIEGGLLEEDSALWPPDAAWVVADTWPDRDTDQDEARYPWILGQPGYGRSLFTCPAYYVDTVNGIFLVAGHRTRAGDIGATIHLYNQSDDSTEGFTAYHVTDGLGRICTVVDVSGAITLTVAAGTDYVASWSIADDAEGLMVENQVIYGLGTVMRWALKQSEVDWDEGRTRAAERKLNAWLASGYWDAQCSPLDWVRDNLLPLAPVSLVWGERGLYPVLWEARPADRNIVRHFTEGPRFKRTAGIMDEGRDDQINEQALDYYLEIRNETYYYQETGGRIGTTVPNRRAEAGRMSLLIAGKDTGIRKATQESDLTYHQQTARLAARALSGAKQIRATTEYLAPAPEDWGIDVGSWISLTSAEQDWSAVPCRVRGKTYRLGGVIYSLLVYPYRRS